MPRGPQCRVCRVTHAGGDRAAALMTGSSTTWLVTVAFVCGAGTMWSWNSWFHFCASFKAPEQDLWCGRKKQLDKKVEARVPQGPGGQGQGPGVLAGTPQ